MKKPAARKCPVFLLKYATLFFYFLFPSAGGRCLLSSLAFENAKEEKHGN